MTKQQIEYYMLYESGCSISEIARIKKKNRSTVSRIIKRARGKKCPFSSDCEKCPLDECAIIEKYAVFLNKKM